MNGGKRFTQNIEIDKKPLQAFAEIVPAWAF